VNCTLVKVEHEFLGQIVFLKLPREKETLLGFPTAKVMLLPQERSSDTVRNLKPFTFSTASPLM